jgi:hypothetical protein
LERLEREMKKASKKLGREEEKADGLAVKA